MKLASMFLLAAACLASAMTAGQAKADILFSDDFTYADGALPSPWINHSGTGGQTITTNQLLIDDVGTGDFHRLLTLPFTSGTIYAGFDLRVSSADLPTAATGQYFAHFAELPTGATANFVSRLFLATGTGGSAFNIGIARGTGGTTTFSTGTFLADTTYRVVQAFNIDTNTATLWIDSPTGTGGLVSTDGTTDPTQLTLFAFRIAGSTDGDKLVDNLLVANTYAEAFSAIPEPGTLGLGLLGLIGMAGFARRRKS